MSFSFSGKVVWITGASSGIGEALVKVLASKGAKTILTSRREEELIRVKKEAGLTDSTGFILPIDLMNTGNIDEYTKKVMDRFGTIDVLICSAGMAQRSMAVDSLNEVDRKIMEVNFFSVITHVKSVLPIMQKNKCGNIVVISSVMGKLGIPFRSMYVASKHALQGYFEALRGEVFRDNITVHIISAGYVKTNISYHAITSKGGAHGKMDRAQQKGISPEKCARGIIKAIEKGKEDVYIGGMETLAPKIKFLFPSLFKYVIKRNKFDK
jgi:short-subunit dehydrogenase